MLSLTIDEITELVDVIEYQNLTDDVALLDTVQEKLEVYKQGLISEQLKNDFIDEFVCGFTGLYEDFEIATDKADSLACWIYDTVRPEHLGSGAKWAIDCLSKLQDSMANKEQSSVYELGRLITKDNIPSTVDLLDYSEGA